MSGKRKIVRVIEHDGTVRGSAALGPPKRVRIVPKKRKPIRVVQKGSPAPARRPVSSKPPPASLDDYQARLGKERYHLRETIAVGGIGRVFRADDELLGMQVAIKSLNPELMTDPGCIDSFKREAKLAMQLAHPHIVRLFNLVESGGLYFLVMEYVEGRTFRSVLDEHHGLSLGTVVQVIQACADALSHAHRHGVLHNDMKPDNIMYDSRGVVRIIDFGTAGLKLRPQGGDKIEGTPDYMSLEQLRGDALDPRSDVFSLAVTAAELLSGVRPFPRDLSANDHLERRGDPDLESVPDEVRGVIGRALQCDIEERWPSVADFADALAAAASAAPDVP